MVFLEKVKQYWAFVISIILIGVITYYSTFYPDISRWWFVGLIVVSTILCFIDKIKNDKDFDKIINSLRKINISSEMRNKILDKQIEMNTNWIEKKEVSLNLLNKLISEGYIDREEIYKPFTTHEIFALYCFPVFPVVSENNKIIYRLNKRLYPGFLKSMGFIRLHSRRGLFYVISKDRLARELKNTFILKQYILGKVAEFLPTEWTLYLTGLKKRKRIILKKEYLKLKDANYKEHIKFNILLLNTDLSENNIGYLENERVFNDEFNNFLKGQIDLTKINIQKEVMGKVVNFVKGLSFELFFFEEKVADLKKLKSIEGNIKSKLEIKSWRDYLSKNDEDLANLIKEAGFTTKKSLEYSKLLKQRIKEYSEALRDLRIAS